MKKNELTMMPEIKASPEMIRMAQDDKPLIEHTKFYGSHYERKTYRNWLSIMCFVNDDILKLACFLTEPLREKNERPAFEIYFDRKNKDYLTYDTENNKWLTGSFERLPLPSYAYSSLSTNIGEFTQVNSRELDGYHTISASVDSHSSTNGVYADDDTEKVIRNFFGNSEDNKSIISCIRDFQYGIMKERLRLKHKKETDPWDEDLKQTRPLPKDWQKWVDKVGIPEQFIFYRYTKRKTLKGYCTYCEHEVDIENPHHNDISKCPHCHRAVIYKSLGKFKRFRTENHIVYLMQKCRDGYMIREFDVRRFYKRDSYKSPDIECNEIRRTIGDGNGKLLRAYYFGFYKLCEYRWIMTCLCSCSWYYNQKGKIYGKSLTSLSKSYLKRTGLIEMYNALGEIDPEKYLAAYEKHPYIEQIVKAGLIRLASEYLSGTYFYGDSVDIDSTQTSLTKLLHLSPSELCRLRECDGGKDMLVWLQYEKASSKTISDDTMKWLLINNLTPNDLRFAASHMSIEQIHHYLKRCMSEMRCNVRTVLTTWNDYLSMATRLGYDTNDSIVYRPSKLKQRHDSLVKKLQEKDMEIRAGEILRDYPDAEANMRAIRSKYEYGDENYSVLVPEKIEDVLIEGRKLHHCVAEQDRYWDRIERDESYVFFLRRSDAIDKPYYTLEVEPGGTIRQKRTMYDRQEADIEEATEFLKKWQDAIKERMTDKDRELAERSRALRILNFEQLKKDNVIINTGKLQGQKLLDVLMADLMVGVM